MSETPETTTPKVIIIDGTTLYAAFVRASDGRRRDSLGRLLRDEALLFVDLPEDCREAWDLAADEAVKGAEQANALVALLDRDPLGAVLRDPAVQKLLDHPRHIADLAQMLAQAASLDEAFGGTPPDIRDALIELDNELVAAGSEGGRRMLVRLARGLGLSWAERVEGEVASLVSSEAPPASAAPTDASAAPPSEDGLPASPEADAVPSVDVQSEDPFDHVTDEEDLAELRREIAAETPTPAPAPLEEAPVSPRVALQRRLYRCATIEALEKHLKENDADVALLVELATGDEKINPMDIAPSYMPPAHMAVDKGHMNPRMVGPSRMHVATTEFFLLTLRRFSDSWKVVMETR